MENIAIAVLAMALTIDLTLGDPTNPIHPVFWLGKVISLEMKLAPGRGRLAQLAYGTAMVVVTTGLLAAGAYFLLDYIKEADARQVNTGVYIVVAGLLLKFSFSIRGLGKAADKVRVSLKQGNLADARKQVGYLVSRNTSQLDEPQLVSATVESVSESANDSFVAPLFYFLILGVPGAIAYRVVNTFDAMVGYHGKYEYLGKFAARLDDLMNLIPARLTALLIVVAAFVCKKNGRRAWRIMVRDYEKTESLNAGWPMSATAGALGSRLEKTGNYKLGDPLNRLTPSTIASAMALVNTSAILWVLICLVSTGV